MASGEAATGWALGQLLWRLAASGAAGAVVYLSDTDGEAIWPATIFVSVGMYALLSRRLDWLVRAAVATDDSTVRTRERVREAEVELEQALRQRETGSAETEAEQVRLTLSDLWSVTHRRLDHYHGIALGQAAKSFRNAQIAMVIGFVLLIAFAIAGLVVDTTAGSVVAGTLGIASAALAGYVSRTFVKSQESAAGHLRAYFDQPLEFSRYLAAERLIIDANLSEAQRADVLTALVQAMIAGPPVPPDSVDGNVQPGNSSS